MATATAEKSGWSLPGLRIPEVAGIAIKVDPSALIIMAFIGWGGQTPVRWANVAAFAVVAVVAILVHELGHAFAFKAFGHRTQVLIHGMGGLTSSTGGPSLTPARQLVTSLAGPLAGFAAGALVWFTWPPPTGELSHAIWGAVLYATFVWGIFNLLPIYPLDGGQALLAIMRAAKAANADRNVRIVSIVVAGGGGLLALRYFGGFAPIFALFFAAQNYADLKRIKEEPLVDDLRSGFEAVIRGDYATAATSAASVLDSGASPQLVEAAAELGAWAALGRGDVEGAKAALARRPPPMLREDRTEVPQDRLPEAAIAIAAWRTAPDHLRPELGLEGSLALVASSLDKGEWGPPALLFSLLAAVPAGLDRVLARCGIEGRRRVAALATSIGRPDVASQALAGLPPG